MRRRNFKRRNVVLGEVVHIQVMGNNFENYMVDTGRLPKEVNKELTRSSKLETQEVLYKIIKACRIVSSKKPLRPVQFVQIQIV